jgi:hypothetical protein
MRALVAVAVLSACMLAATACGSKSSSSNGEDSKTVQQIIADVQAATNNATAVHVSGSGNQAGAALKLDLHLVAGKGGYGHITYNGLDFDVVRVGNKAYFRGDATFWKKFGGAAAAALFKDRWIEAPADSGDLASFTPLTDISKLMSGILGSASSASVTKGVKATIGGKSAIQLVQSGSGGGTLYIATTGKPYPLELQAGNGASGTITFDDWDKIVAVKVPSNALDYSQLKSAASAGG